MAADARFQRIFRIMLAVFVVIRVGPRIIRRIDERWQQSPRPTTINNGQRWVEIHTHEGTLGLAARLLAALLLVTLGPLYVIAPDRVRHLAVPLPAWLRWLGVVTAWASLPVLAWTHFTLGRAWSTNLELQEQHTLVTNGPYRWVRHPMYTSIGGFMLGSALVTANGAIILPAGVTMLVMLGRIDNEEAMMVERFGPAYHTYMRQTGRLLPRIRS